jgi:hypothetical protein
LVSAGTGRTDQDFNDSTSTSDSSVLLAGLYGSYNKGGFYADALMKYEYQLSAFNGAATLDEDAPYKVNLLGASFETG